MPTPSEERFEREDVTPQSWHSDLVFLLDAANRGEQPAQQARVEDRIQVRYPEDVQDWVLNSLIHSYNFIVRNRDYLNAEDMIRWKPGEIFSIKNNLIYALYQAASVRNEFLIHEVSDLDPEVIVALAKGWEE